MRIGEFLFTSGQIGLDPQTGKLVPGGVAAEARQVMKNLGTLLEAGGANFHQVIKTTIFLTNIADFSTVNQIYAEQFSAEPPARSTLQVAALPGGALVEIEAIAAL